MTAATRWIATVRIRDDRGVHLVEVGTYATAREASAIAARSIVTIATPIAVEVAAEVIA